MRTEDGTGRKGSSWSNKNTAGEGERTCCFWKGSFEPLHQSRSSQNGAIWDLNDFEMGHSHAMGLGPKKIPFAPLSREEEWFLTSFL